MVKRCEFIRGDPATVCEDCICGEDGRKPGRVKLMPIMYALAVATQFMFYALPLKSQTLWGMGWCMVLGAISIGLAYLDDLPEEDGDGD